MKIDDLRLATMAVTVCATLASAAPQLDFDVPLDPSGAVPCEQTLLRAGLDGDLLGALLTPHGETPSLAASSSGSGLAPTALLASDDVEGDGPAAAAFSPDGATYYVAHRVSRNIVAFDAATRAFLGQAELSGSPLDMALSPDGTQLITANGFEDTLSVVDVATLTETAVIDVAPKPIAAKFTPDGLRAVVIGFGAGELSVVDLATSTETLRVPDANLTLSFSFNFEGGALGFDPGDFAVIDNATALIPDRFNDELDLFDLNTGALTSLASAADPAGVAVASAAPLLVVSHVGSAQTLTLFDTASKSVTGTVPTGVDLFGGAITLDPGGTRAAVSVLNAAVVVDLVSGAVSSSINTASVNEFLTTADGLYALAVGFRGSLISFASSSLVVDLNNVISASIGAVSPVGPRAIEIGTTFGEDLVVLNTNGAAGFLEAAVESGPGLEADSTRRTAIAADGSVAVLSNIHSDTASIVDVESGAVLAVVEVGDRPSGVAITPDGSKAVVANLDSDFASVIDLATFAHTPVSISRRAGEVEIAPDGSYAYLAVVADGDGVWRIDLNALAPAGKRLTGNMGGVGYPYSQTSGLSLSPDGSLLVSCGSFDDTVTLLETVGWTKIGDFAAGNFPTRAAWSPDGTRLYVAAKDDDNVREYTANSSGLTFVKVINVGDQPYDMQVSADGSTLYVLEFGEDRVRAYDIASGAVVSTAQAQDSVAGFAFLEDRSELVLASGSSVTSVGGGVLQTVTSGALQAFDAATGAPRTEVVLARQAPADLKLSADGSRLAAASLAGPGLLASVTEVTLSSDRLEISVSAGGSQSLALDAGANSAGRAYLVLGSLSGTTPGFPIDAAVVPLVVDAYTLITLTQANQGAFNSTFGILDASGCAQASIDLPAGANPVLVGLELDHAFVALDPINASVQFASNAAHLALIP